MGHLTGGRRRLACRSISRIGPLCCLLLLPALARAQTVVPRDTTRRAADSARAPGDTTSRRPADSLRPAPGDSARAPRPDSAGRGPGGAARPTADTVQPAPAAAAPAAIGDSVLAAACAEGGSLAANLLVVLFAPTATESDRAALAKAVGGTLAGPADAVRAGGYYLHVPNGDLDPTVADRVIRYPTVAEVGPVGCPPR
jgi:hypothetical protein